MSDETGPFDALHTEDWEAFGGYPAPEYTQVPNLLLDWHMALLSGAELKVLLYIVRRTVGFHKQSDDISLSQMLRGLRDGEGRRLENGCGLSKSTLLPTLASLEAKHLIERVQRADAARGNLPTTYRLHVAREVAPPHDPRPKTGPRGVQFSDPPLGRKSDQPLAENQTTQKKDVERKKEDVLSEAPSSSSYHARARDDDDAVSNREDVPVRPRGFFEVLELEAYASERGSTLARRRLQALCLSFPEVNITVEAERCARYSEGRGRVPSIADLDCWIRGAKKPLAKWPQEREGPAEDEEEYRAQLDAFRARAREEDRDAR